MKAWNAIPIWSFGSDGEKENEGFPHRGKVCTYLYEYLNRNMGVGRLSQVFLRRHYAVDILVAIILSSEVDKNIQLYICNLGHGEKI